MPERQSRHPDNELIDRMTEDETPDQQGSAGGDVNTRVGARAERPQVHGDEFEPRRLPGDAQGRAGQRRRGGVRSAAAVPLQVDKEGRRRLPDLPLHYNAFNSLALQCCPRESL